VAGRYSRGVLPTGPSPDSGERFERVIRLPGAEVMLITSSDRPDIDEYVQTGDEWVVVLSGSAVLEIDGDTVTLDEGEWVHLPAEVPHRVIGSAAGTRWLAVHSPPEGNN
jgi:cupin 2 domain-containing protein